MPYIQTHDGSFTYLSEAFGEKYHSLFGAMSESKHVFISNGLELYASKNPNTTSVSLLGYRDWETDRKSTRLNSSH